MRSLIIGAAGFVGAYLIRHLHQELGHQTAVTKLPHEQIRSKCCDLDIYNLDILDADAVFQLLQKVHPDYIFHLAAQSSVAAAWKNPGITVDINIHGVVNVLEAVRKLEFRTRILLVGSGEEYGLVQPDEIPVSEENRICPGNIYAATKACQNMLGKIYARAYGLEVIMVRAFNHIGPNQEPLFVVADFCRQVAWIEAGRQDAHMNKSKANIMVETDPSRLRPVDLPVIEANIYKLQKITGWKPLIGLEQTVEETLDYWRQRAKADR